MVTRLRHWRLILESLVHTITSRVGLARAVLIAMITYGATAQALTPQLLTWEELLSPKVVELQREIGAINRHLRSRPRELRTKLRKVMYKLISSAEGIGKDAAMPTSEEVEIIREAFTEGEFEESLDFWKRVRKTRVELAQAESDVRSELNGQFIRMAGYLLPLEFQGTDVREFLLVPFIGACIHVPPPSPNQIVYVTLDEAFASEGLYAPVWIEGVLNTNAGTYDLSMYDGTAPVDAGYSMDGAKVELYER